MVATRDEKPWWELEGKPPPHDSRFEAEAERLRQERGRAGGNAPTSGAVRAPVFRRRPHSRDSSKLAAIWRPLASFGEQIG
jgi:hypothetical protein